MLLYEKILLWFLFYFNFYLFLKLVAWSSMSQLTSLRLHTNQLSGTLPSAWSSMSQLTGLSLNSNKLNGTLPVAWSSMNQLTGL